MKTPAAYHASDPVGRAANSAALMASRLDLRLFGAASPRLGWPEREDALRRALTQWPALCACMAELEAACPDIAAECFAVAGGLREIAERSQTP